MGLFDSIKRYFLPEKQQVYCQNCEKELTDVGGDITNSKKIYCHGAEGVQTACGLKALFNGREMTQALVMYFYTPAQVQKAIRKKELTTFGPLEQKVEE